LKMDLDPDNVDTIGGWLYSRIEIPPQVGHKVSHHGDQFFVEEVDHMRITRVLIKLHYILERDIDELE